MKRMNKILFGIFFASSVLLIPDCKTTFTLTNEIKSIAENMTPVEAAHKLSAIIEKNKTGASIGLDDVYTGGLTTVGKDSITYYKTVEPKIDKTYSNFTGGYETVPTYSEKKDLVITVNFSRVKSIKIHELKGGDVRITLKDGHNSFQNKTMYQFETTANNHDVAIALCSKLIPNAEISY